MVHYKYNVKTWDRMKIKLLELSFHKILLDKGYKNPNDGKQPYVEYDENEGFVSMRRMTNLKEEGRIDMLKKMESTFKKVSRISGEGIRKEYNKFKQKKNKDITKEELHDMIMNLSKEDKIKLLIDEGVLVRNPYDENKIAVTEKGRELLSPESLQELIQTNIEKIKDEELTEHRKMELHDANMPPCKRCSKTMRADYHGYCMDCADELGVSEMFPEDEVKEKLKKLKEEEERFKDANTAEIYKQLKERQKTETEKQLNYSKENKSVVEGIETHPKEFDEILNYYNIPLNDRLKNYQLLLNLFRDRVQKSNETKNLVDKTLSRIYTIPEGKRKVYAIEDYLANKLMKRKNVKETLLPYPATIVDCVLEFEDRAYVGFVISDVFIETTSVTYTGIITCYSERLKDGTFAFKEELIVLDKDKEELVLKTKVNSKYNTKIRNFVYGLLNFIHEPDVEIFDKPLNPRNNERRTQKGRMELPAFSTIKITGQKRVYLERTNKLPLQPKEFRYQQDFPSTYVHYRNTEKYKRIYELANTDIHEFKRRGYSFNEEGVARKKRIGFTRFKDKPRREVAYVVEEGKSKNKIIQEEEQ